MKLEHILRPGLVMATLTLSAALLPWTEAAAQRGQGRSQPARQVGQQQRVAPIPTSRRQPRETPPSRRANDRPGFAVEFPTTFRSINGRGNNPNNATWGQAETPLLRLTGVGYADGQEAPSGENRPSARAISNACAAQEGSIPNEALASDYLWQWGQFVDHDIDLSPTVDPAEPFDITVPAGDPFFDPQSTGEVTIGMDRSFYEVDENGVRQQINIITAFVDASNVYGSDEERAFALRMLDGSGRLKTSEGNLLPFNTTGLANAPTSQAPHFFLAGDERANEQAALAALHTLFVREHNYWTEKLTEADPSLSGEELYQMARVIVAAEIQRITYDEFLPLLLGKRAIPPYQGYRPEVNPAIANCFSTAAYRLGHSMLSTQILRLDANGQPTNEGHLSLAAAFFNPSLLIDEGGIDPLLRGLGAQVCQRIDNFIIDDVRNFLFGAPGSGGFDLASLNIQRGRDHGLASYNQTRRDYGLRPVRNFSDITRDRQVQQNLADTYNSVEDIDLWVGGLAEQHVRGALVGPTYRAILGDQFRRLRDGDRFWYESYLSSSLVKLIEEQSLARIIRRNTDIGNELQDDVFRVPN